MSGEATGTEARVCADIAARQRLGIEKYGTTVADNPLGQREWLQHAYEEALDLAIYLKRAIDQIDAKHSRSPDEIGEPRVNRLLVCPRCKGAHPPEYNCNENRSV